MSAREAFTDWSKGDNLRLFWKLFRKRENAKNRLYKNFLTTILNRMAHRHGGYVGNGAKILGVPSLPHGLHGIFISRYSTIEPGCRIYQNVTIGEVDRQAPHIGEGCLIGSGAIIVGNIRIGKNVKIGAGTVVFTDVPDNCTVVTAAPRIINGGQATDEP